MNLPMGGGTGEKNVITAARRLSSLLSAKVHGSAFPDIVPRLMVMWRAQLRFDRWMLAGCSSFLVVNFVLSVLHGSSHVICWDHMSNHASLIELVVVLGVLESCLCQCILHTPKYAGSGHRDAPWTCLLKQSNIHIHHLGASLGCHPVAVW